jgi:hypothetical protein
MKVKKEKCQMLIWHVAVDLWDGKINERNKARTSLLVLLKNGFMSQLYKFEMYTL